MRLTIFATGTLNTCFLPVAINWLRATRQHIDLRIVLSTSAARFVSVVALSALSNKSVALDDWSDPALLEAGFAPHVTVADTDVFLVYPASLHTIGQLAAMSADTPCLNAVQCTQALVVVAPNLPPGAEKNQAVMSSIATLANRPGVLVVDPVKRASASSDADALVAPPIWDVIADIEARLGTAYDIENVTA